MIVNCERKKKYACIASRKRSIFHVVARDKKNKNASNDQSN